MSEQRISAADWSAIAGRRVARLPLHLPMPLGGAFTHRPTTLGLTMHRRGVRTMRAVRLSPVAFPPPPLVLRARLLRPTDRTPMITAQDTRARARVMRDAAVTGAADYETAVIEADAGGETHVEERDSEEATIAPRRVTGHDRTPGGVIARAVRRIFRRDADAAERRSAAIDADVPAPSSVSAAFEASSGPDWSSFAMAEHPVTDGRTWDPDGDEDSTSETEASMSTDAGGEPNDAGGDSRDDPPPTGARIELASDLADARDRPSSAGAYMAFAAHREQVRVARDAEAGLSGAAPIELGVPSDVGSVATVGRTEASVPDAPADLGDMPPDPRPPAQLAAASGVLMRIRRLVRGEQDPSWPLSAKANVSTESASSEAMPSIPLDDASRQKKFDEHAQHPVPAQSERGELAADPTAVADERPQDDIAAALRVAPTPADGERPASTSVGTPRRVPSSATRVPRETVEMESREPSDDRVELLPVGAVDEHDLTSELLKAAVGRSLPTPAAEERTARKRPTLATLTAPVSLIARRVFRAGRGAEAGSDVASPAGSATATPVATVSAEGRGGVDGATPLSRSGVASEPIGEFVVGAGARIDRQATPDSTVTQEPRSAQRVRVTEIPPARTTAGALIYRSIAASDGTDPVAASRGIQRPAFAGTNGAWQSDSGGPGSGDEATHGSAAGQVELASVYAIARADAPDSDGEPRTPAAAGASGPGVTEAAATAVETMAHEVYGLLRRRLIVERERSGLRAAWLRD